LIVYVIGGFVRFDIKKDFKKDIDIAVGRALALKVSALLLKNQKTFLMLCWCFEDT
jgi:hypothetical protein